MWELEEGIRVVRALQGSIREFNYHLAIGGGVVNKGQSDKDLDLYFLPMQGFNSDKNERKPNPNALLQFLVKLWGDYEPLDTYGNADDATNKPIYNHAVKFFRGNKRIDCFIF